MFGFYKGTTDAAELQLFRKTNMDVFECYREANNLASLLDQEGAKEHADLILNAMAEGCTGSEICMALKWHIKDILKLDFLSKESKKCARLLHKDLGRIFQACD